MKVYHWLLITFLLVLGFWLKLDMLLQIPYANGWDGYYYLMQIKSLLENNQMQSPDFALIYPYLLFFKIFTKDYVLAYKIAIATAVTIFSISAFYLVRQWTGRFSLAIFAMALIFFSPTLNFFAPQFLKNLLGIITLLWFFHFFFRGHYKAMLMMLIIAFFAHRLVAAVAIFLVILYFIQAKYSWKILAGLAGAALLLVLASVFLPGILHLSDWQRFSGQLQWIPQLAPLSLAKTWLSRPIDWLWIGEAIILYLGYWLLLINTIKSKNKKLAFMLVSVGLLIFPFLSFDVMNPGYRFFLAFLMVMLPFTPLLLRKQSVQLIYTLSALLVVSGFFSVKIYQPERHDPPHALYFALTQRMTDYLQDQKVELIIAHKGLAEVIIFETPYDALNWKPDFPIPKNKVWRIAYGVQPNYFKNQKLEAHPLSIDYYLVKETDWKELNENAGLENDSLLLRQIFHKLNPARQRPVYLQKGKNIQDL